MDKLLHEYNNIIKLYQADEDISIDVLDFISENDDELESKGVDVEYYFERAWSLSMDENNMLLMALITSIMAEVE